MNQAVTRAATWALGFAYAVAWAIAGWLWRGPLSDLDYFFVPAARIALSGHPLLVYTARFSGVLANDNGPLGLVPLTAVALVAAQLNWLDDVRLRRMLFLGVLSVFSLLMAREAVAAIERLRGASLKGLSRVLAFGVFAISPTLWNAVLGYGHVEQPMTLWLVLLGVRRLANDRPRAAGISFGLALLTRGVAVLPMIPLLLLLLVRGRRRAVAVVSGFAALVVALGLLPFVLADPGDTIYSLLTHRGNRLPGGGSIWQLVVGTPYQWIPQRADILFVLGLAVVASLLVIRARGDLEPSSRDIYGLLALAALTLPLLAKTVWPYYFLDAYVFGAVWWLGQSGPLEWGRRFIAATIPLIAVVGMLLTEYEIGTTDAGIRLLEGVTMGFVLAVLMVAVTYFLRLPASRRRTAR